METKEEEMERGKEVRDPTMRRKRVT
jgi:hypothetical protein